jgi:hypothetical protein
VVHRFSVTQAPLAPPPPTALIAEIACAKCTKKMNVQVNFEPGQPADPNAVPYPAGDRLACPGCGAPIDLKPLRDHLEKQLGRPIVAS